MRVLVAMSGGVDSSVAAALLKEQGHEVIGITLKVWSYQDASQCGSCCSPQDINDARAVASALGIPFYVSDVQELFRSRVVDPFVRDYLSGRTPIPCVACNEDVKFGVLLARARSLGAKLATGHYARIDREGERWCLRRGSDGAKDQSYFLFTLGQAELGDLLFPVGDLTKDAVRRCAERWELPTSRKPESMEICFVPDGDYAGFVERQAGRPSSGRIVDAEGASLGVHGGIHRFTVGQRRGLGVATGVPLYVQRIVPERAEVVVGTKAEASRSEFLVERVRWVSTQAPQGPVVVKIRHRHAGAAATLRDQGGARVAVILEQPLAAITPGQAAVFYQGDVVLGGGWISSVDRS